MSGWDPQVLAGIQALHLRARELVAGFLMGAHASVRVASNVEFADHKEYAPGDNLRDLDWRVMARSDRLVVRRHQAETELAATIVLDASADMGTGEGGALGSKWQTASVLAATLAYWLVRRGEPVGLAVAGGEGVRWPWLPPRGGQQQLVQVLGDIAGTRPGGQARLDQTFATVGARLPRRSLVVVISDLMEDPSSWGPALAALVARRTDLRVVQLVDPREWSLDFGQAARFVSPEGGEPVVLDPAATRPAFAQVRDEYLAEIAGYMGAQRAHHVLAPTDQPLGLVLRRLLVTVG